MDNQPPALQARLREAREKLESKDLAGALAIYDEVLAAESDNAGVLLIISGDLGSTGHVGPIVELIAPRYDPARHGPAAGLNLLQAYLLMRNAEAAQHVLDLLFALDRPELEERLHGFSNAISDLLAADTGTDLTSASETGAPAAPPAKGAAISISKPIWFYGLETLASRILPPKAEGLRRIAFTQLALPSAYANTIEAEKAPEDEPGRLSRALPLWLAETFYFSPHYAPVAAFGMATESDGARHPVILSAAWTIDNMRQLVATSAGGLDYILTGALRGRDGVYELELQVWDAKKFRERKRFAARWTPATAAGELAKLRDLVCLYMEWTPYPAGSGTDCQLPAATPAWLDALGASLGVFLAGKKILPKELIAPLAPTFAALEPLAAREPVAALAWLTLAARARELGIETGIDEAGAPLAGHPVVAEAREVLKG